MLPLHTTFRNLVSASFTLLIISSCSNRSNADLEIVKELEQSIDYSSKILDRSSEDVLVSLKNKLYDAGAAFERANYLYPKAEKIHNLSNGAFDKIEKMKADLGKGINRIFLNDSSDLYEILINYKKNVLLVDSSVTKEFEKTFRLFTGSLDLVNENQRELLKDYFHGASLVSMKAMLSKLQNNIRVNEERMLTFCHERIATHPLLYDYFSVFEPFVYQSSSYVKDGEEIEVKAGVGSFISTIGPQITIGGINVPLNENAFAIYRFRASKQSGKHVIPIKIRYIENDGREIMYEKEIEYTVAKIQKQ